MGSYSSTDGSSSVVEFDIIETTQFTVSLGGCQVIPYYPSKKDMAYVFESGKEDQNCCYPVASVLWESDILPRRF